MSNKKKWLVHISTMVRHYQTVEIDAESEQEAIDTAQDMATNNEDQGYFEWEHEHMNDDKFIAEKIED